MSKIPYKIFAQKGKHLPKKILEDKTQKGPFPSSELLLKPVLWLGAMSWPQRKGQRARGSPFADGCSAFATV